MASKVLVAIELNGGMDGVNFVSPRDATSVSIVQSLRQGAPANVLDYTEAPSTIGDLITGSNTINNINVAGIAVGNLVYGVGIPAQRALTVISVGTTSVVMSDVSYVTLPASLLYFATATQLFKLNESISTGRNPAFNSGMKFCRDAFNVLDIAANSNLTKMAIVGSIGPLRKKLAISAGNLTVLSTGLSAVNGSDIPSFLTSHNDQTSTWQSNAAEGSVKGWGGGIADTFLGELSPKNVPLASVSVSTLPVFTAGTTTITFGISPTGLIRKIPGYDGLFTHEQNSVTQSALSSVFLQAMTTYDTTSDVSTSANTSNILAKGYQNVLNDVINLTDIPSLSALTFNFSGSDRVVATTVCSNLRSIARMILANNPNRGGVAVRSGNVATITTEISTGVANRTAGSTSTSITASNHRLFTSSLSTLTYSDSAIIIGSPTAIDAVVPTNGYRITLDPSDVNNKFNIITTDTSALVNVPVTVRLKHNLRSVNTVYISDTGFDSAIPTDGYPITSIVDNVTFTITTTASGAYTNTNLPVKFKLINLTKQICYTGSPSFTWDSHPWSNASHLAALDACMSYFQAIVERIADADVVSFLLTEFGRTLSTNSQGTDHGWGNTVFTFGKSVRGNKVYGQLLDYTTGGANLYNNYFMPNISVYQYAATFAKWIGTSDAQVMTLFPDLNNWPVAERYLGFLDALV